MYFTAAAREYTTKWWWIALRGAVMVCFGALAIIQPEVTAKLAVFLFAVGLLADGIIIMLPTLRGKTTHRLWPMVFGKGVVELIVGVAALSHSIFTLRLFAWGAALLVMFRGVLEFISFVELDTPVKHQRVMLLSSVAVFAFGVLLLFLPFRDEGEIIWLIGGYLIMEGLLKITRAWRESEQLDFEHRRAEIDSRFGEVKLTHE